MQPQLKITSGANSDVLIDQHGILLRKWEEELSQYSLLFKLN